MNQNQQPTQNTNNNVLVNSASESDDEQNEINNLLNKRSLSEIFKQIRWRNLSNNFITQLITNINNNKYIDIADNVQNNNTPLMVAIRHKKTNLALAILRTGQSNPRQVNNDNQTALLLAIKYKLPDLALAIVQTGQSNSQHVTYNNSTALMEAIQKNYTQLAIAIIRKGMANIAQINNECLSAYSYAIEQQNNEIIQELERVLTPSMIITFEEIQRLCEGNYNSQQERSTKINILVQKLEQRLRNNPEQPISAQQLNNNNDNQPENIITIFIRLFSQANLLLRRIIYRGNMFPGNLLETVYRIHYDISIMRKIVYQIIFENNQFIYNDNIQQINEYRNLLTNDIAILTSLWEQDPFSQNFIPPVIPDTNRVININSMGFNNETQEEQTVQQYIRQNPYNMALIINNKIYLINKNRLRQQSKNNTNNKYSCKRAGNNSSFILDSNINFNPIYFSLSAIIGVQILVKLSDIQTIVDSNHRYFIAEYTNKNAPAIMSLAFYNGDSGVSADHCQTGKETPIFHIMGASSIDVDAPVTQETTIAQEEEKQEIKVQYKGEIFKFPIDLNTTIGNIREMLLNKLSISNNPTVRFIFKGKIYNQDNFNDKLTTLENPPFGITLQSQIILTGGRKKLTKKNINNKKKLTKYNKKKLTKYNKRKLTKYNKSVKLHK